MYYKDIFRRHTFRCCLHKQTNIPLDIPIFLYKKKIKKIKGKCVYINRYMRMYTPWKILNKVIDRGKLIMKIRFKNQFNNVTFLWTQTVKMCTFVVDKATSSLFPQCYDLVVVEFNGFFSMVSSIKKNETKRKENNSSNIEKL